MSLMVSISGVRGIVGESLTPDVIVKYAGAFAEYCHRGRIVVGRDGRAGGKIIGNLVSSTLLAAGCDVVALGVAPTPTIALAVEHMDASGGISITASHNPIQWNGLKFIGSSGLFLDAEQNRRLWGIADGKRVSFVQWNEIGKHVRDESFIGKHIEMVLKLPYVQIDAIRQRHFNIVVDCINAAGGVIIPALLRELGCRVVEMNCDVSGVFHRSPEPIPENLGDVCARVRETKADLGIVVDPDVDRLVLVDEKGEPFGEEYTITSVVDFVLRKGVILPAQIISTEEVNLKSDPPAGLRLVERAGIRNPKSPGVVVNLSTTRAIDDVAKKYVARVFRTPVGEINVAKKMIEVGAIVGGEGSGGVILPALHYGRDAIVGIALILQQLAEFGGTLSEFKSTLPQYVITKTKVDVTGKKSDDLLETIRARYLGSGKVNTDDGLKIDFPDSWVHLRKSNTEPIIRIIAEAPTAKQANRLIDDFKNELRQLI